MSLSADEVRLVATDVDGTLTDGGMYYAASGDTLKRFNVRDGLAVKLLHEAGLPVVWISSDTSPVIEHRAQRLGVKHCQTGISDKVGAMQSICDELGASIEHAAYLGDDFQDLALLEVVGLPAAVADAHDEVKKVAVYQCVAPGGQGAFREFAEHLLRARGDDLVELWERSNG